MIFRLATTEWDAEVVRIIRNTGRQWMTRDTREIGYDAQQAWWQIRNPDICWVYVARIAETDIGYGMLRLLDDDRWWASLAVLPRFQGNGYGSEIYRYLALSTAQDVWAEILADNTPSIKACLNAGFQIVHAMDRMAVLVHKK